MKGLLKKDLQILWMQKRFICMLLLISVFMCATAVDASFLIGYMTFMCGVVALGTISYDEYDNGYVFLFTLPITRKLYVASKYLLTGLVSIGAWCGAVLISIVMTVVMGNEIPWDTTWSFAVGVLAACLWMILLMIPVQLKFGAEKSRLVMFGLVACILIIGYVWQWLYEKQIIPVSLSMVLEKLDQLNLFGLVVVCVVIGLLTIGISFVASIRIMERKQL